MKNILLALLGALIAAVGIYYYQKTNTVSVPGNTVSASTSLVEDTSQQADEATNSDEVVEDSSLTIQDQNYCAGLGPQSGNAANSTFFVSELEDGDTVTSGYMLRGCVKNIAGSYGNWGPFEGQVGSAKVKGSDGSVLLEAPVSVSDLLNWLDYAIANEHIPYEQELVFSPGVFTNGTIEIKNENPSGESTFDETITYTISF